MAMHGDDSHWALAEEWDRRYSASERLFRAEPDESLVKLVAPLDPARAVDLGAGEGRNSLWLARHRWTVFAVDASRVALDRLSQMAQAQGLTVHTVASDLVSFLTQESEGGRSFDLAVMAYVHPEPRYREELLESAAQSLSPGGYLLVVGHHLSSFGVSGPPDPARLYTEDDLRAIPGLETISLEQRRGVSDVTEPATDLVLWARRPASSPLTRAS